MNYYWKAALAAGAVGIVCVVSSTAVGDDQTPLVKLLSDPTEQQHVISVAGRSTVILQNPCPTAQYTLEKKISFYKQPSFDSGSKLVDGAWKQVVDEEGCGVRRILNVLVFAQGQNNVSVVPLLPGTTRADAILQRDAVKFAVQAAATVPGGREENCQIGYVADTEFIEQESVTLEGAKGPSWRELWTLVSCTHKMQIPVHFIPDSTGTSISAGPNTAIKVIPLERTSQ
jgi:hypothetical protein